MRTIRSIAFSIALVATLQLVPDLARAAGTSSWVAGNGAGLTYASASCTAASFNSLASGSDVVCGALNNATALDLYADVSFSFVNGATATTAASYFAVWVLPLNQDGTTYGDGSVTGSTFPSTSYLAATCTPLVGLAASGTITGTCRNILLPPGSFKFAIGNSTGGALNAAAAAVVQYRTYNENLNR